MLVKYCMKREFYTLDVNDPVRRAVQLLKKHRVCILPVLDGQKLEGVVTERGLRKALGLERAFEKLEQWSAVDPETRVSEVMTRDPITISPDSSLEDVVRVLIEAKIPGTPVVDAQGAVVGIITQTDLYRVLLATSGFMEKGAQFAFELEDRPGSLKEVTDIIRKHGGRIACILTSYETAPPGFRHAYVRVFALEADKVSDLSKELSSKAKLIMGAPAQV
ncbi:MAG: CBS domain-containing protein [Deltaproteobacteria bacterium]|nr:CBS domain-containing protein [Deltaproteobacteria bacterium]